MSQRDSAYDEPLRQIGIGADAEAFVLSPLGKYLIGRSERELEQAVNELKYVQPHDTHTITELQFRIRVAESVPQWLADAIQEGQHAENQLREDHHD